MPRTPRPSGPRRARSLLPSAGRRGRARRFRRLSGLYDPAQLRFAGRQADRAGPHPQRGADAPAPRARRVHRGRHRHHPAAVSRAGAQFRNTGRRLRHPLAGENSWPPAAWTISKRKVFDAAGGRPRPDPRGPVLVDSPRARRAAAGADFRPRGRGVIGRALPCPLALRAGCAAKARAAKALGPGRTPAPGIPAGFARFRACAIP